MTRRQRIIKRAFDVAVAVPGLILLSPLLAVLMLAVRATSPGPALYRQLRVGRQGQPFRVVKLRTMRHSPDDLGSTVTTASDERVTPLGRRLRRYHLDEIPQLWNVIRGEMSIVGPRPDVPGYADELQGRDRRILGIRPGITGPATLYFRDEESLLADVPDPVTHNALVVFPIKTRLNLEYLDHWSLRHDLGYIVITVAPGLDRWIGLLPDADPAVAESRPD